MKLHVSSNMAGTVGLRGANQWWEPSRSCAVLYTVQVFKLHDRSFLITNGCWLIVHSASPDSESYLRFCVATTVLKICGALPQQIEIKEVCEEEKGVESRDFNFGSDLHTRHTRLWWSFTKRTGIDWVFMDVRGGTKQWCGSLNTVRQTDDVAR